MPCQRPQNHSRFYGGLFIVSLNGNIIINDFEHTNKYVILSTVCDELRQKRSSTNSNNHTAIQIHCTPLKWNKKMPNEWKRGEKHLQWKTFKRKRKNSMVWLEWCLDRVTRTGQRVRGRKRECRRRIYNINKISWKCIC